MSEVATAPALSVDDARRLTERIRYTALSVRDGMEKLQRLVEEARTGQAHMALGYKSWTAYLADTLGKEPLRLARDDRQALVGYLAGEGMSTRAIAPIVGVSQSSVDRDLELTRSGSVERPATVTSLDGRQRPASQPPRVVDTTTGEVFDDLDTDEETFEAALTSARAEGDLSRGNVAAHIATTDHAPARRQPPRRALTDQFFDAAYDMTKAVEKVARLVEDDRFHQNAEKVAAKHRSDLLRAHDLLSQVIASLPNPEVTSD